jgi:ABC-type cobalamin/Fe3+-siderophores transport system ATPase subunit
MRNEKFFVPLPPIMMLELHNVTIGQLIRELSLTVDDGRMVRVSGPQDSGKTTLLRAVLGFLPIDDGFISIDGELLTPLSAPYFRRFTAYVPQQLSVPDGYDDEGFGGFSTLSADERYLFLLRKAVGSGKPLLIVDEPSQPLGEDARQTADDLLAEAVGRGCSVLAVTHQTNENTIRIC